MYSIDLFGFPVLTDGCIIAVRNTMPSSVVDFPLFILFINNIFSFFLLIFTKIAGKYGKHWVFQIDLTDIYRLRTRRLWEKKRPLMGEETDKIRMQKKRKNTPSVGKETVIYGPGARQIWVP